MERQRYVKFRIVAGRDASIDEKLLAQAIWRQFGALFGEIRSGKAGLWITAFDPASREGIIRCSNAVLDEVIATLALLTSIDGVPVSIDTSRTSGIAGKLLDDDGGKNVDPDGGNGNDDHASPTSPAESNR